MVATGITLQNSDYSQEKITFPRLNELQNVRCGSGFKPPLTAVTSVYSRKTDTFLTIFLSCLFVKHLTEISVTPAYNGSVKILKFSLTFLQIEVCTAAMLHGRNNENFFA